MRIPLFTQFLSHMFHKLRFHALVACLLPLGLALLAFTAQAAPGDVDLSFDPGGGPNADIYCVATQPDGKALIGGAFTSVNGTNRNRIARLNSDGSLDTTFDPGQGANDIVITLAPLADGKVLIAGAFTAINGVDSYKLARLNANGTLDTTFDTGATVANDVFSLAVQPDGKVLAAGRFPAVFRFNADGTVDEGFNSGAGASGAVYALGLQPDGKVLAAGTFSMFNEEPRSHIARLN